MTSTPLEAPRLNYSNSLLTMIPVTSQWGRYHVSSLICVIHPLLGRSALPNPGGVIRWAAVAIVATEVDGVWLLSAAQNETLRNTPPLTVHALLLVLSPCFSLETLMFVLAYLMFLFVWLQCFLFKTHLLVHIKLCFGLIWVRLKIERSIPSSAWLSFAPYEWPYLIYLDYKNHFQAHLYHPISILPWYKSFVNPYCWLLNPYKSLLLIVKSL